MNQNRYISKNAGSFKKVHDWYKAYVTKLNQNRNSNSAVHAMSYETFMRYKNALFPSYSLHRVLEDCCDTCTRLEMALMDPNLTDNDRELLILCQGAHDSASRNHRVLMHEVEAWARNQKLPIGEFTEFLARVALLPETVEDDLIVLPEEAQSISVDVQMEDFAGTLPLPMLNLTKFAAAYYHSHLSMFAFVICNITYGENRIILYDERAQGKGAEALCNLRFRYYFEKFKKRFESGCRGDNLYPILYLIMDNCVGQNKSQAVFKFFLLMSLMFYRQVIAHFNLSGHSHLCNDVVTGHAKTALRRMNTYHPKQMVECMNSVKGIVAEFIDHENQGSYLFTGWENFLDSLFPDIDSSKIKGGYTSCFFFEFKNGSVHIRREAGGDIIHSHEYVAPENIDKVKNEIMRRLLGPDKTFFDPTTTMADIKLDRHPKGKLTSEKIQSIQGLLPFIPYEWRSYYPDSEEPEKKNSKKKKSTASGPDITSYFHSENTTNKPVFKKLKNAMNFALATSSSTLPVAESVKRKVCSTIDNLRHQNLHVKKGDLLKRWLTAKTEVQSRALDESVPHDDIVESDTAKTEVQSEIVESEIVKNDIAENKISELRSPVVDLPYEVSVDREVVTVYGYTKFMRISKEISFEELDEIRSLLDPALDLSPKEQEKSIRYLFTGVYPDQDAPFYVADSKCFVKNKDGSISTIGKGIFARTDMEPLSKEKPFYSFRGEIIDIKERDRRRRNNWSQCYLHSLDNGHYLDCLRYFRIGLCPLSNGNSACGLITSTGARAVNNLSNLNSVKGKKALGRPAGHKIEEHTELLYPYGKAYNLKVQGPPHKLYDHKEIHVALRNIQKELAKNYKNSEGYGFCFLLTLCQIIHQEQMEKQNLGQVRNGRRSLRLRKGNERKFFVEWLATICEKLKEYPCDGIKRDIQAQLDLLSLYNEDDLKEYPVLDLTNWIVLTLTMTTDFFLPQDLKFHLWTTSKVLQRESFESIPKQTNFYEGLVCGTGSNQSSRNSFNYHEWIHIFQTGAKDSFAQIFLNDGHYYEVHDFDEQWYIHNYESSLESLISNFVHSVLPEVRKTYQRLDFDEEFFDEEVQNKVVLDEKVQNKVVLDEDDEKSQRQDFVVYQKVNN